MNDRPSLSPEDEAFIEQALQTGRYASREEILTEGLDNVRRQEAAWARLHAKLRKGIESLDRGEGLSLEETFDELDNYIAKLAKRRERKDAA
jgi:antitoxin ParD1/3/4